MQEISYNHHPGHIAVIDGRRDISEAVADARAALLDPAFHAAVIVRDSPTITESADRAAKALPMLNSVYSAFSFLGNSRLGQGRFARMTFSKMAEAYSKRRFEKILGCDVSQILESLSARFRRGTELSVREWDFGNSRPHLDSGNGISHETLPGGLTATVSLRGGGTVIGELQREWVDRGTDAYGRGPAVWTLRKAFESSLYDAIHEQGWQVADGDVCLMRAKNWPETHLPALHSSPRRKRDGDVRERIVGVAFL